ncbi:MAG: hypothetical protein E6K78_03240 [Candidatus Eisenbacteria bacterium]|uniref:CHRD domain-containing protein n=1 Tax=Eiseniibacteriota bacterium TaxID=2212470 RepID=A0A538TW69_UNCEI|nr:MAG: hypothetical protein E6K78_03240 [Candidatus Eisenbacteria bacterium]
MRRLVTASLAVVILGIAGMALAASDRHVKADLAPLASSGISGTVDKSEQLSGTMIRLQVKGLQPGVDYISTFYQNHNCETEAATPQNVVASFKANPAGIAIVTAKLATQFDQIGSVSVRLRSDQTVQACGSFAQ